MKFQIYYKNKISIDFEGINKIIEDGREVPIYQGIEDILKYLKDEIKYNNISIRYMNDTIIPSPVEFNQITNYDLKRKIMNAFQKLNNIVEFIKIDF